MMTQDEQHWMELALTEARQAAEREEVPVGAILLAADGKTVLAADGNRIVERHDPTAMQKFRSSGRLAQLWGMSGWWARRCS